MGKLFVIDGTDGSGKQTQFQKLQESLTKDGIDYKVVSFPNYDSPSSSLVKMYLSGEFGENAKEISPYIASTFYAADRYATFQKGYKKYYEDGGIILADRYTTANMVHQAGKIKDAEVSIGANAIYRAVKERKYGLTINDLPHGREYFKKAKNVHTITKEISEKKKEISIEVMPKEIKNKETETHFEGDSVVGVAKGRHETLITLVNTASQFLFIRRSANKTGQATVETLDKLEEEIPQLKEIIESLLLDNGVEFSKIEEMMRSVKDESKKRFQIYFTHPYASYERGCNENKNRLIRRYFKKGKLVEELSDEDIINIARKINNMPRKALGYKTPLEVFESNLKKRGIDTSFLDIYRIELPKCLVA